MLTTTEVEFRFAPGDPSSFPNLAMSSVPRVGDVINDTHDVIAVLWNIPDDPTRKYPKASVYCRRRSERFDPWKR